MFVTDSKKPEVFSFVLVENDFSFSRSLPRKNP